MNPAHEGRAGRIVVGIDGSTGSTGALAWAATEAALRGSTIHVVNAWQPPPGLGSYGVMSPPEAEVGGKQVVEEAVGTVRQKGLANVTSAVVPGSAGKVLTEVSAEADLLVIGSRGRGGFAGLLLGSVGQYCAAHAQCPTVIVHPGVSATGQLRHDDDVTAEAVAGTATAEADAADAAAPFGLGDDRLEALRSRMEAASHEFIGAAVSFVSDWIPRQVASVVEGNPRHTLELGTEGIKALKAEMLEMVTTSPAAAGAALGTSVMWPHRLTEVAALPPPWEGWHEVDQLVHRPPEELIEGVDNLVGRTRSLLVRHGYVRGQAGDVYVPNYGPQVEWSKEMMEASNDYCRLYRSYYDLAHQSVQEAEATAKDEARKLWAEA